MNMKAPFNLYKWIEDNKELLKPPVGNKNLYVESGDYIVMIVGGPNARKDYHYNETEELFFQLKGDILVKTQQNGKCVDVHIKEGEMFLLPAKIPHSPIRSENSVGLVIERKRKPHHKDGHAAHQARTHKSPCTRPNSPRVDRPHLDYCHWILPLSACRVASMRVWP